MEIDTLIIEVTRQCRLNCQHCLRGTAQKKNISERTITALAENITNVGRLTLTGGEPFLVLPVIRFLIAEFKRCNVEINSFYIATSGVGYNALDVLPLIVELYSMCRDIGESYSKIELSSDTFHIDSLTIEQERQRDYNRNIFSLLTCFEERTIPAHDGDSILYMGRGKDCGCKYLVVSPVEVEDNKIQEITVNVNGDFVPSCDLSYSLQEFFKLCNVRDITYETPLAVLLSKHNKRVFGNADSFKYVGGLWETNEGNYIEVGDIEEF